MRFRYCIISSERRKPSLPGSGVGGDGEPLQLGRFPFKWPILSGVAGFEAIELLIVRYCRANRLGGSLYFIR